MFKIVAALWAQKATKDMVKSLKAGIHQSRWSVSKEIVKTYWPANTSGQI